MENRCGVNVANNDVGHVKLVNEYFVVLTKGASGLFLIRNKKNSHINQPLKS